MKRQITMTLITLSLLLGLGTAVAQAQSGNTIYGCYHKSNGHLRRVNSAADCTNAEIPISWNVQGLQGAQGPQGIPGAIGPQGPQGPKGETGATGLAGKVCPAGQFVTGFDSAGQLICRSVCPVQVAQATLKFENEGLDLETGAVSSGPEFPSAVDFHFAYNGSRPNPTVLFQDNGSEIAFLDGTPFDAVDCLVVDTLTFTRDFIDVPFDSNDTIVIRTAAGNVFKVGKPVNNGDVSVNFSYAKLK
jgi:hypothetical protein